MLLICMAACAPTSVQTDATLVQTTPTPIFTPALSSTPEVTASWTERVLTETPIETPTSVTSQKKGGTVATPSELTYEMDLAINPPPPADLAAKVISGGIKITWNPPPPVLIPHHYTDVILFYKIYRRTESTQFVFLTQTTEISFLDKTAVQGTTYYYSVTAQHENGVESSRPDEINATP